MRISYKGDYALKAVIELGQAQGVVKIIDLAKKLDIPQKFLESVLLELQKGGFLKSKRGKEGGYSLAKAPAAISLGELVRHIDGPIEPIACVDDCYKGCSDLPTCGMRKVWQKVTLETNKILDNVTIEDLISDKQKANSYVYHI